MQKQFVGPHLHNTLTRVYKITQI